MSGSNNITLSAIACTLRAGIGGPPPRPGQVAQTAEPFQRVDFSGSIQQTLIAWPLGALGGQTDCYVSAVPPAAGDDPIIVLDIGMNQYAAGGSSTQAEISGNCYGRLTSGQASTNFFITNGGTQVGDVTFIAFSGSAQASSILHDTTVSSADTFTGTVFGEVTLSIGGQTFTWDQVTFGESDTLNVIQGFGVTQDIGTAQIQMSMGGEQATESIFLNSFAAFRGTPISLEGNNFAIVATAMDYCVDYEPNFSGNNWIRATNFAAGYGWTAEGPLPVGGTHSIVMRDANNTDIISNYQQYSIAELQLNAISAQANVPAPIGGFDFEAPPAGALQYQLNGESPWTAVGNFSTSDVPGDSVWTGIGPAEPPGYYTLQVRNTAFPNVVSNVVPYQILAPGASSAPADNLAVWSVPPNWEGGVLERLEWLTDVLQSITGVEQRIKLRLTPRRTLEMSYLLFGADRRWYDLAMKAGGTGDWLVPLWHDLVRLESPLAPVLAGSTASFTVNTLGHEYTPGALLVLWGGTFDYEVLTIASVAADSVTLTASPVNLWPTGTRVMPLFRASLAEEPEAKRQADNAIDVQMGWQSKTATPFPGNEIGLDTYNGYPVLTTPPDETDDQAYKFDRIKFDLDPKVGLRTVVDTAGYGFGTQQFAWFINGYPDNYNVRGLLYQLAGMLTPIWIPTFFQDFQLVKNIYASDTAIQIALCGYTLFNGSALPGRQNIRIELYDGTNVYAEIAGSSINGQTERVELTGAVGQSVTINAVKRISFMALARQQADTIEIQHEAAGGVSTISTIFREAPDNRIQYFQVLDPTKTNVGELSDSGALYTLFGTEPTDGLSLSVGSQTTGKWFIEAYVTQGGVAGSGLGFTLAGATVAGIEASAINAAMLAYFQNTASVFNNGATALSGQTGWTTTPNYFGMLLDLDNNLVWFCNDPNGPYNFNANASPPDQTGGIDISWRGTDPVFFFVLLKNSLGTGAQAEVFAGKNGSSINVNKFSGSWPIAAPGQIPT